MFRVLTFVVTATLATVVAPGGRLPFLEHVTIGRTADAGTAPGALVDGHLHYVDFVQESSGMDALFSALDRSGVSEAVVLGMPLVKTWAEGDARRPTYYLDNDARTYWYSATDFLVAQAVLGLPAERRRRLHPFICGFNSADRNGVDHIERLLRAYPGLWEGIGEVFLRHDELTALTYGEAPRATSAAFGRVLDLAATHDLPVLVHSNIGSSWRQQPDYLDELETAVRAHPRTRVIWAHAGISRRIVIENHTDILRRLLGTYPNLSIDLSWVLFEQEIAPGGRLDARWVTLVEDFPTRFTIGSDTGDFSGRYTAIVQRMHVLLDALTRDTARLVGHDNLLRLLPGGGQTFANHDALR